MLPARAVFPHANAASPIYRGREGSRLWPHLRVRGDMTLSPLTPAHALPENAEVATLVGRIWLPDVGGPSVVKLEGNDVLDISRDFPTMSELCEQPDPAAAARAARGSVIGPLAAILR